MNWNRCQLMGRLTREVDLRYIPSGQAVATLSLAVNSKWGKSDDRKEETLFIDITAWSKTAENCAEFLSKGSAVFIEGRMKTESWDDKDTGKKRTKIGVSALSVQFLDGKKKEEQGEPSSEIPF